MTAESKRKFLENHRDRMLPLKRVLDENGLDIPKNPNPNAKIPQRWLLRDESNKNRLLDINQRNFQPQSGQMGSYGVFLGDCLTALMHYKSGAYYLFDRDTIDGDWLSIPSESYTEQMKRIGRQHNLRIERLSDGLMAETILFKHSVTYQPTTGIVTVPYPLDLDRVSAIFLSSGFLNPDELKSLPSNLREKITTF
ncbi:MAG: hypothetical protein AAB600_05080 [Patescibacteria group bacterium]